jgi:hypothetical protein
MRSGHLVEPGRPGGGFGQTTDSQTGKQAHTQAEESEEQAGLVHYT